MMKKRLKPSRINLRSACKNRRGMTLVEVIVSLALLAIVTMVLGGALLAGLNVLKINMPHTKKAMAVAGAVDNAHLSSGQATSGSGATVAGAGGGVTVTFGTSSATVSGVYQNGSDSGSGVSYWSFNPN